MPWRAMMVFTLVEGVESLLPDQKAELLGHRDRGNKCFGLLKVISVLIEVEANLCRDSGLFVRLLCLHEWFYK